MQSSTTTIGLAASGLGLNIRPHLRERGKKMVELFAQYATAALLGITVNPRFLQAIQIEKSKPSL